MNNMIYVGYYEFIIFYTYGFLSYSLSCIALLKPREQQPPAYEETASHNDDQGAEAAIRTESPGLGLSSNNLN